MVLMVGLMVVFSVIGAEQTTKGKKRDPVTEVKESQGQQKAPAPVSKTIKVPAAAVKSLPLAIQRLYLKDDKVHVVIEKTGSKRLSDEAYSTTKLKIETRTLKQPLEWTLLKVDPTRRLTRIRGVKDFNTGLEVKDRIQVTATLYKGSWKTAKQGTFAVEGGGRLNRKLGEDHPRVRRLEPGIERQENVVSEIEVELEGAEIKLPAVAEESALVHGRVCDEKNRGIAGLTVTGENEKGQQLRFFGQAETDASGYYSFVIGAEKLKKLARFKEMYLTLRTPTGRLVYRKPDAIKVTAGDRVVVNVNLRRADLYPKVAENEKAVTKENENVKPPPGIWTVRGRITDEKGEPLTGLTVSLFDKDQIFDDLLGVAVTDENGNFEFTYREEDFEDFLESNPDLYVEVQDQGGRAVYSSRKSIRFEAGREEVFNIRISKALDILSVPHEKMRK